MSTKVPCLKAGNFNSFVDQSEKQGGGRANLAFYGKLISCIQDCGLIDLGFVGFKIHLGA